MTSFDNNNPQSSDDHLEVTDVLSEFDVSEAIHGVHTAGQPPAQAPEPIEIKPTPAAAPSTAAKSSNSFDIVFQLSGEREAALRERKIFKDRAAAAEARVAQLESDLAAAHAQTKLQMESVNRLDARCIELQRSNNELHVENETLKAEASSNVAAAAAGSAVAVEPNDSVLALKRLLQERDNKIHELELQLGDRAGAPTLIGGELEILAAGITPKVVYALESLENPGETHKLTRATNTVGRSKDNDVHLGSNSVSRFHARLVNKADGLWIMDQHSVNGCHVNGKRVTSQILSDGDLVMIGHCRFRLTTSAT